MSQFDAFFADSGRGLLLEHMGQSVTYKDPEEEDVALTAIVGEVRIVPIDDGEGGIHREYERDITFSTDHPYWAELRGDLEALGRERGLDLRIGL